MGGLGLDPGVLGLDLIGSVFEGGSVMREESVTVVSSAFRISLSNSISF